MVPEQNLRLTASAAAADGAGDKRAQLSVDGPEVAGRDEADVYGWLLWMPAEQFRVSTTFHRPERRSV